MNRILHALLPAALLMLVFAISSALIVAAWLMIGFCLGGINRFALPMGLFGLTLWLGMSSVAAQPRPTDEYIVIHERTISTQTLLPRNTSPVADTTQRTQSVVSKSRTRKIKPVPAWPDETPMERNTPDPAMGSFIFTPDLKPGSSEIKGFYGIRIRP